MKPKQSLFTIIVALVFVVIIVLVLFTYGEKDSVGQARLPEVSLLEKEAKVSDLQREQEAYRQKYGEYKQIKTDRTKPEDEPQNREFDEKNIPKELVKVNQWKGGKCGQNAKGAQLVLLYRDRVEHIGVGDCAEDYTYTVPRNDTATST